MLLENTADADPALEQVVPGHRLLSVLGEGGMGTVYRAEQLEPLHRLVAVKVIKPGMDSKQVLARFELERQSLAAMDHEAIAKVFGCGATTRGQPFFAMELVPGLPLHRYCDQHRLPLPARIRLFQQVCEGVQHAHQKGVIHRDLKPGNILVVEREGHPVAKIIDFGVARAADPRQISATLFTEQGAVIGTPEYMSPEQATGDLAQIDTRTDVYSLGVVLYELLVGVLPFPGDELRAAGVAEIQRRLCHDDPLTPSRRLTGLGREATTCAAQRSIEQEALRRELARDLDWVVLRAMAKEPDRRYASAQALAEDLQRYLAHEPLQAGPPTAIYRLRKLLRRHRGPFAAGAAILLTAVLGAVLVVQFALREQATVREFRLVSGEVRYARAVADELLLYPARQALVPAMERWLREVAELSAMRETIAKTLAELRSRALPTTAEELAEDRRTHPRAAELAAFAAFVDALRRAQAVREGRQAWSEPEPVVLAPAPPLRFLETQAWRRVAPERSMRTIAGEEAKGLAFARAAAQRAERQPGASACLLDLAWACFANGLDDEAHTHAAAALEQCAPAQRALYEQKHRQILRSLAEAPQQLARHEQELAALRAQVASRRTFRFADAAEQFLHDTLATLSPKIDHLVDAVQPMVERRLRWARSVAALTADHPRAKVRWAAARAAIASSDRYAANPVTLRDQDVVGLVPIGPNPVTGLWEFYDLESAWDGISDPATLPIPEHRPDGSIEVGEATGIVFVLLPGGTVTLGAQAGDPDAPHHDRDASAFESVHEVSLAPFLIARHEVTQSQWARLWTWDEALQQPSFRPAGTRVGAEWITGTHPVEMVNWEMGDVVLRRHGYAMPTEAQWECACRAGTTTPWSCAYEELPTHANLSDASNQRGAPAAPAEPWDDGFEAHAPVGSLLPNAFGLYDMLGNVWEWCRDWDANYAVGQRLGDGLSHATEGTARSHRGSAAGSMAKEARSAHRGRSTPSFRGPGIGIRAVRNLRPTD